MAMRRIVQSLGNRTFKYVYAARSHHGSHQQGHIKEPNFGNDGQAEKVPPHHKEIPKEYQPSHHNMSWEQVKDDISQGRPGGQQAKESWMEKAKETLGEATEYVKEKATSANLSQTAEKLKEGAKEKLHEASEYLKGKADTSEKDLGTATKEKFDDLKEGAKDKLAQAQEFVRKQTITDASKKVKDTAKDKYEDLMKNAEQKKNLTDQARDEAAFRDEPKDTHTISGERTGRLKSGPGSDTLGKNESNVPGENTSGQFFKETSASTSQSSGQGIFESVKEKAATAAEWVKDKFTPSGSEKPNVNAATDEKVQAAADKLKSDHKASEEDVLKESANLKQGSKPFSDNNVHKPY